MARSRKPRSDQQTSDLIELTKWVVQSCVSHPEEVAVSLDRGGDTLVVSVAPRDRGKLIGRSGNNLNAIETALAFLIDPEQASSLQGRGELPFIEVRSSRQAER